MSSVVEAPAADKSLDVLLEEVYGVSTAHAVRQEWVAAVRGVAAKATEVLPAASAGRIAKAAQIVLHYGVELLPGGTARVESQTDAGFVHHLANGTCDCKDFERAPAQWCKHRLARALHLRALRSMEETTEAIDATPVEAGAAAPMALPEAPASVNFRVTIGGRDVQMTLRDTDEARLLVRLTALLAQYPVEKPAGAPEGWCAKHNAQMRRNEKDGRCWWSHKAEDGSWCKGK